MSLTSERLATLRSLNEEQLEMIQDFNDVGRTGILQQPQQQQPASTILPVDNSNMVQVVTRASGSFQSQPKDTRTLQTQIREDFACCEEIRRDLNELSRSQWAIWRGLTE